jgi:hypothetical protein
MAQRTEAGDLLVRSGTVIDGSGPLLHGLPYGLCTMVIECADAQTAARDEALA